MNIIKQYVALMYRFKKRTNNMTYLFVWFLYSQLVLLPPSAFTSTRKTTFDHISNTISNFNKNQYEEENWDFDVESYDEFGDHINYCSTPNYPDSESEMDIDIFPEAHSSSGFMDSACNNLDPNTSPITITPVTPLYRWTSLYF